MPTFTRLSQPLRQAEADSIAVFAVAQEDAAQLGDDGHALAEATGVDLTAELAAVAMKGELGSVALVPTRGGITAPLALVVGLGAPDGISLETLRRAAGSAARKGPREATLAMAVPLDLLPQGTAVAEAVQAVVEGVGLGSYAYTDYRRKSPDTPTLERVLVSAAAPEDQVDRGILAGTVVVEAQAMVRDLINTPPAAKRPPTLADRMAAIASDAGLQVRIWDEDALAEGGFGGILGVGQGSSQPPRMVELTYQPEQFTRSVVLVGKGITFDSGGLSLKPTDSMVTMKSDMSGAAAVLGAMVAAARTGVPVKVTGLLALAENLPSGSAIRVSDVLTHRNGTTVEVMNTDAEGRLVMADALAYGAESEPDAMIDVATLTGAQVVALGTKIAGLMGSDEQLVAALEQAAERAGERVWHLPLPEDYAEQLKSPVADLRNIGRPREAGTLIAGLYLKEFTAGRPWAHLDIAGPAFTAEGDDFYTPKGATGFGVRTLLRYLQDGG